ncbi:MAG: lysine exporter LysO family protein [Formosimonas sp.]
MLTALYSLLPVFAALLCGLEFHRLKIHFSHQWAGRLSNACMIILLFGMGMMVADVPDIARQLLTVGASAAVLAVVTSLSIMLGVILLCRVMRPQGGAGESHATGVAFSVWAYLKDPLQLFAWVILGFVLRYANWLPHFAYEVWLNYFLYAMIFFIGLRLSQSNIRLREILLNPFSMALAVTTVVFSSLGAWLCASWLDLPVNHALAASSGFGWYTLSGIALTQMDEPVLGSIAFLSDLFREVIALLLVPMLARHHRAPLAIGVCGATCMDVTLPLIEKNCAPMYVPIAFISGALITVAVPFLIPFFYYWA